MPAHLAVPLAVAALHAALAAGALAGRGDRRARGLFGALAGVLAAWSASVFQIRHASDEVGGLLGQRVLNLTFGLTPALYYHLVRVLTGTSAARRTALRVVYVLAAGFALIALVALPLLVRGVVRSPRGWAPVTGPLGLPLFVFYLAVMVATLGPARAARRRALVAASLVMLLAPLTNFVVFILVALGVLRLELPPLLLPAGVVFIALVWFATHDSAT
ncbi:MAG TPA: hypothetical protein VMQ51_17725 [Candidatus Binatia bacterium]|nr:hypothetical protein [Candidatus Binatia bacterium]